MTPPLFSAPVFALGLLVALLFLAPETAEARTCRSIGLSYNRSTGACNWDRKSERPRYKGRGNVGCANHRPAAVSLSQYRLKGANNRVPYMRPEILDYLVALKFVCPGLVVQSTYRDCSTNRGVKGKQKSKHLCGGAADTSGCPSAYAKEKAAAICRSEGLTFINEGPSRFPHCQSDCQ